MYQEFAVNMIDDQVISEFPLHHTNDNSGSSIRSSQVVQAHRYSSRVLGSHKYRQVRR